MLLQLDLHTVLGRHRTSLSPKTVQNTISGQINSKQLNILVLYASNKNLFYAAKTETITLVAKITVTSPLLLSGIISIRVLNTLNTLAYTTTPVFCSSLLSKSDCVCLAVRCCRKKMFIVTYIIYYFLRLKPAM